MHGVAKSAATVEQEADVSLVDATLRAVKGSAIAVVGIDVGPTSIPSTAMVLHCRGRQR